MIFYGTFLLFLYAILHHVTKLAFLYQSVLIMISHLGAEGVAVAAAVSKLFAPEVKPVIALNSSSSI